jgi:peptidoglycan/xylan/chitin deacetylase (PgdA/CDA1 family)
MNIPAEKVHIPLNLKYLRRKSRVNPIIVNYHMVSDEDLPYIKHLYRYRNRKGFIRDLDFFSSNFRVTGLGELLDCQASGIPMAPDSLLITFDDGFREVYDIIAPILSDRGLTATFFLTTDFLNNRAMSHCNMQSLFIDLLEQTGSETTRRNIHDLLAVNGIMAKNEAEGILQITYLQRQLLDDIAAIMDFDLQDFLEEKKPYLNDEQVIDLMAQGFTFGAHSKDHARFNEITVEKQVDQAVSSVQIISERFSAGYRVFAFPYTDLGISGHFFRSVAGKIDATFGTAGLLSDTVPNNYQRISVEKFPQSAERTVRFHYARKIIYDLMGRGSIIRE